MLHLPAMPRTLLSAAKVKAIRESRALTQRQAAKLMGWRRGQSWAKLEWQNTDVRVSTLAALAATFACTMENLLEIVPDKPRRTRR
jgi:DNA-binding XRE family transcriptional regulator